jgi:hypothetical protein
MKTCPECGNESPDMAVVCIKCKYSYPVGYNTHIPSSNPEIRVIKKRPTGGFFIVSGNVMMATVLAGMLIIILF